MAVEQLLAPLALAAYIEARGESLEGKKAICHVVLNRAEQQDKTVHQILDEPGQFPWNKKRIIVKASALSESMDVAREVLQERQEGFNLEGADHFHATSKSPKWKNRMKKIAKIGRHIFYKNNS